MLLISKSRSLFTSLLIQRRMQRKDKNYLLTSKYTVSYILWSLTVFMFFCVLPYKGVFKYWTLLNTAVSYYFLLFVGYRLSGLVLKPIDEILPSIHHFGHLATHFWYNGSPCHRITIVFEMQHHFHTILCYNPPIPLLKGPAILILWQRVLLAFYTVL